MPSKMNQLLDMLGVASDARLYKNTEIGSDELYGEPAFPLDSAQGILFPRLISET